MKVRILAIVISSLFVKAALGQVNWNATKEWKVFKLNNIEAFNYPVDTLNSFRNVALADSVMHSFLKCATKWPKEKRALWMGFYLTTYQDDSLRTRKCVISNYGGFLFDDDSKTYYEIPVHLRDRWMRYINDNVNKLFSYKY